MLSTAGVVVQDIKPHDDPILSLDGTLASLENEDLNILVDMSKLDTLEALIDPLEESMRQKLCDEQAPCMLPTCLNHVPEGSESGSYLSVDLGGSTARVAFVKMYGCSKAEILYKVSHPVSAEIKCLSGKGFFRWLASKIGDAINHAIEHKWIPADYSDLVTGLSWSFPFRQHSVERGFIAAMGKGYTVTDEILGWDLKESFETAAQELGARIRVTAVVNDTAASLMAHAYASPQTRMGLILGTGINACAMFPTNTMGTKAHGLVLRGDDSKCLVNTELSMFGTGIIPDTRWDDEIDRDNERPGYQPLECKVSGRYLGEIVRLIVRDFAQAGVLFKNGALPRAFDTRFAFESSLMASMEQHHISKRHDLALKEFSECHPLSDGSPISIVDIKLISEIITIVSSRAAGLTACSLVALAAMLPEDTKDCVIAYNGTVIEKYPMFLERCQKYLDELGRSRGRKLILEAAGDGSLLGPAVASAMFSDKV